MNPDDALGAPLDDATEAELARDCAAAWFACRWLLLSGNLLCRSRRWAIDWTC